MRMFIEVLPNQFIKRDRIVAVSLEGKKVVVGFDDIKYVSTRDHTFKDEREADVWAAGVMEELES